MTGTADSEKLECYFYKDNDPNSTKYDFTKAVTNTKLVYGRNQPFMCIEITVSRYVYDSAALGCPKPVQNFSIIHITTYGGHFELLFTQSTNTSTEYYTFYCYSKMYLLKKKTLKDLIGTITWNGNTDSYKNNQLRITTPCGSKTYSHDVLTQVAAMGTRFVAESTQTPTFEEYMRNFEVASYCHLDVIKIVNGPFNLWSYEGSFRVLVPIYQDTTLPRIGSQWDPWDIEFIKGSEGIDFRRVDETVVYASLRFTYHAAIDNTEYAELVKSAQIADTIHTSPAVIQAAEGNIDQSPTYSSAPIGILRCEGVEYITGYTSAIFGWLCNRVGGYTGKDVSISTGYGSAPDNYLTHYGRYKYTAEELKNTDIASFDRWGYPRLSVSNNCYDTINAIATYSNRWAFFYDRPYFISYGVRSAFTSDRLVLSYSSGGEDTQSKFNDTPLQLMGEVTYLDQGSTYLTTEQTASSSSQSVTVTCSDAQTPISGTPIEIKLSTDNDVAARTWILQSLALHQLQRTFVPGDTFSFVVSEKSSSNEAEPTYTALMLDTGLPTPSSNNKGVYYVNTGIDDNNLYLSTGTRYTTVTPVKDDTCRIYSAYRAWDYVFDGTDWVTDVPINIDKRNEVIPISTVLKEVEDKRANVTLNGIPLSYVMVSYPECETTYMFGAPQFQDTEQAISALQTSASNAVTTTSVSNDINSSNYTKISLGKLETTEESSGEDLTGYSGIVIEKNDSNGTASITGYSGGKRQIKFNSDGSVSCGIVTTTRFGEDIEAGDSVIMDRDGFRTRSWHEYDQSSPQYQYSSGYWVGETSIGTDGKIVAGAGAIDLGSEGLKTYNADNVEQCSVGTDGKIVAGTGAVKLDANGLKTYDSTGTDQCTIGTDGAILAGNRTVVLDNMGLRTYGSPVISALSNDPLIFSNLINEEGTSVSGTASHDSTTTPLGESSASTTIIQPISNATLQCSVGTDGAITAGAGAVKLDANGLKTYDADNVEQCSVGTDGKFTAKDYTLSSSGLMYKDKEIISTVDDTDMIVMAVDATKVTGNLEAATISAGSITAGKIESTEIEVSAAIVKGTLNAATISANNIKGGEIDASKITVTNIDAGNITSGTIKADKVTVEAAAVSGELSAATISGDRITGKLITADKIKAETITGDEIAGKAITTDKLAGGNISAVQFQLTETGAIQIGSADSDMLALTTNGLEISNMGARSTVISKTGNMVLGNESSKTAIALTPTTAGSGRISFYDTTDATINTDGTITNGTELTYIDSEGIHKIANQIVTEDSIVSNAITTEKLKDAAVETSKIKDEAVTDAKIQSITANKITAGEISSEVAYLGSVGANQIRTGTLQADTKIQVGSNTHITGSGLYTTDSDGTVVCAVESDGNISGVKVKANNVLAGQLDVQSWAGDEYIGTGSVKITASGLTTYSGNGNEIQCSIGTDGVITAGQGAVSIDNNGITTYDRLAKGGAISSSIGEMEINGITLIDIDDSPKVELSEYSVSDRSLPSVAQCYIGTDGAISAGSGKVLLNANGITIDGKGTIKLGGYTFDSDGLKYGEYSILNTNSTISTSKLDGKISNGQLEDINTSKLTGTISTKVTGTKVSINADCITAGEFGANVVYAGAIGANQITTSNLSAGTVTLTDNGAIKAGNVTINKNGITIGSGNSIDATSISGQVASAKSADSATSATNATDTTKVGTTDTSRGYVEIDKDGLRTYSTNQAHSNVSLQCSVGTDGAITAGQGAVKLDRAGLKTYNSNSVVQCSVGTDGAITAGAGAVKLGSEGLKTYNADNVEQCSVGTDGAITAGQGTIKLDSEGLKTYEFTSTTEGTTTATMQCSIDSSGVIKAGEGAVRLDREGLRTYNSSGDLQCSVGTDGVITAGAGAIKLDTNGLKTYNADKVEQCSVGTDGNFKAGDFIYNSKGLLYQKDEEDYPLMQLDENSHPGLNPSLVPKLGMIRYPSTWDGYYYDTVGAWTVINGFYLGSVEQASVAGGAEITFSEDDGSFTVPVYGMYHLHMTTTFYYEDGRKHEQFGLRIKANGNVIACSLREIDSNISISGDTNNRSVEVSAYAFLYAGQKVEFDYLTTYKAKLVSSDGWYYSRCRAEVYLI